MKILLLGKNGQVGWELQRSLQPLGSLIALDRRGEGGLVGDLTDLAGLRRTLLDLRPDVIVNAAAYTAVDRAESEPALARRINAEAPEILAQCTKKIGGWLVHYSTDYVFDGRGNKPWREENTTCPLSVYGQTKREGELAIEAIGCQHLIFRTSWVYSVRGRNFAKTILRLAAERKTLKVVDDQFGAPTNAELIADVTAHALRAGKNQPELGGLYHLAAAGEVSWYGYANFIINQAVQRGKEVARNIQSISSSEYSAAVVRPMNSRLNTRKLCSAFSMVMPPWQQGVIRMLDEIQGN